MEKKSTPVVLAVSNPQTYLSLSVNEAGSRLERVSYSATGTKEAIEQYIADFKARSPKGEAPKMDADGNPIWTCSLGTFAKIGKSGSIVRGTKPSDNGTFNYFADTNDAKSEEQLVSGLSVDMQHIYQTNKLNQILADLKSAKARSVASRSAFNAEKVADLKK